MTPRWLLLLYRLSKRLGVRVLFGALLALVAVALAPVLQPLIPEDWQDRFGADAVTPILQILATTMLTVTTFSLSVMVQAFQSAASQATPRAYRLHLEDSTAQTALAAFTGTFLFSLTSLVLFNAGFYSEASAVVIFFLTIGSIVTVIVAMLRWIGHLSVMGSMDHTLQRVENSALPPLERAMSRPSLGAARPDHALPSDAREVPATKAGYVQYINLEALEEKLSEREAIFRVTAHPGAHLVPGMPLGQISGGHVEAEEICECFTLGEERTMEQDARYGVMVMNEIALRALSPAVNDPGTAIDVVQRLERMLFGLGRPEEGPPEFPHVQMAPLNPAHLVEDGFYPLIRDGAARPEVIGCVLTAMNVLRRADWPALAAAAEDTRAYAFAHAEAAFTIDADKAWLAGKREDA
ncbi:cellulose-binding protein [Salipiger sp. CCB-MM3]|uniref:DUF2254 domain-containing protein n=1 Tax=Roseobacteraceae TaxID=2854170 RepID=UPI00080AACAE|nr:MULTISPECIES: DUF2254 domain-containing protein [Roseobacteraceae]ANT60341.1 cellulose-binding protein [Salipiger sp. CCB-MM3]MCA0997544.1 DUF2254 domain-containing protein [Alloyangia pacifica]